jgi:hypothetical protein
LLLQLCYHLEASLILKQIHPQFPALAEGDKEDTPSLGCSCSSS